MDIDDTIRQVHGYRKQAVAWGYNKVKGLNAIIVTVSTPASVPVVVGIGLRRGSIRSGQNAAWYLARSVSAVRSLAPEGTRTLVRADSAFATHELITAVIGMGGLFLVTVPQWPTVKNAIASVKEEDWTAIRYPRAVWDEACGAWVSDAQVAETRFTAFTSYPEAEQVPCRLVVRRVKDQRQAASRGGRRPGRAVSSVAISRVHHQHRPVGRGGGPDPPAPRHNRAGHCRAQGRTAGPHAHFPNPNHLSTSTPRWPRPPYYRTSASAVALGPDMAASAARRQRLSREPRCLIHPAPPSPAGA
ncbi:transposase [Actinomyces trachealis]|uniref:transposase n=1 Tax=Actinomyces trachealis TaxID=2763540 RepID=UPI001C553647|nr:transposase [Actinomyces trachealis]